MTEHQSSEEGAGGLRLTEAERSWGISRSNGATVYAEHDVERILADRLAAVQSAATDREVRLGRKIVEAQIATSQAALRAESAEAENTRLRAQRAEVEALADEWAEDYPGPDAACNRTPDEWATDLRKILAGGGAR